MRSPEGRTQALVWPSYSGLMTTHTQTVTAQLCTAPGTYGRRHNRGTSSERHRPKSPLQQTIITNVEYIVRYSSRFT